MLGTYSAKKVVCLVDGVPITGLADGDDAITVERSADAFSLLIGADGEQAALFNPDRSGVATIKLLQTSRSNFALTTKLKIQEAGQLSPFPFGVKDTGGLDLVIAPNSFVVGPPTAIYGAGHNAREWRLILPSVDIYLGGTA